MLKTILIFFSLLVMVCTVSASEPPLGMWAWKQAHFDTAQARSEMLDFCEQEGISHIDQHVSIHGGAIKNADAFKCLIAQAAQRGITVNALRGDKAMFLANNYERTLNAIETLVSFNRTLPEEAKLLGIKFDVEPYLTAQWKAGGEQRDRVMLEYLNCLTRARAYLKTHSPGLELAVDVPFWWDKDEYMVNFEGNIKHFVHHIQDCVDWLGICLLYTSTLPTKRIV